jgi:hypothetical protein
MEPSIGRALSDGFRAANRSWAGIGFFLGTLLLMTVISLVAIASTNPPAPPVPGAESPAAPVPVAPTPPAVEPPASTSAADSAPPAASGEVNLFNQLETAQPPVAPAAVPQLAASDPVSASAAPAAVAQTDEQTRAFREWFGRAWPLALFILLLMLVMNVWLSGGQIGYLAAQVSHQPAKLSALWQEGTRAFGRLLGAWALLMGAGAALLLVLALLASLLSPLPQGVRGVLGVVVLLAALAAGAWLVVRLAFWFIAVVVDRVGPMAGLKASWRMTQGRWLKTAGLGLLVGLISIGVSLIFGLVEGLGRLIGGWAAVGLGLVGNLAGIVASLYIGFAALAAFIRFYQDVKGQAAASP